MKLLSELYNVSLDILLDDNVNLDEVSGRKGNSEDREPTKTERQISNVQEQYTRKEPFQLESINLYMFVLVSTIIPPLGIVICMIVFFKALRNGGRKQVALLLLCALCASIDIYNTLVVINNISNYWFWGSSTVEKISMVY